MTTNQTINSVIAKTIGINEDEIKSDSHLFDDLGADSLDVLGIVMSLEDELNTEIIDGDAEKWRTVEDVYECFKAYNSNQQPR